MSEKEYPLWLNLILTFLLLFTGVHCLLSEYSSMQAYFFGTLENSLFHFTCGFLFGTACIMLRSLQQGSDTRMTTFIFTMFYTIVLILYFMHMRQREEDAFSVLELFVMTLKITTVSTLVFWFFNQKKFKVHTLGE